MSFMNRIWPVVLVIGIGVMAIGQWAGHPYVLSSVGLGLAFALAISFGSGHLMAGPAVKHPRLVVLASLIGAVCLVISNFAGLYREMSDRDPTAFIDVNGEGPLDSTDALYLSLAIVTTTGFGDIRPVSSGARALVSAEMVAALALAALAVARVTREFVVDRPS